MAGRFGSVGQGQATSSFGRGPASRGDVRAGRSDSFGASSSSMLASDWTSRPGNAPPPMSSSLAGLPSRGTAALGVSNTAIEQQHALEMARMERELLESRKQQEREREERIAAERLRHQEAQHRNQRSGHEGYHSGRQPEDTRGWRDDREASGPADSNASWRRAAPDRERNYRDDAQRSRGLSESEGTGGSRNFTSGNVSTMAPQGHVHLMQRQTAPSQSSNHVAVQQPGSAPTAQGPESRFHESERGKSGDSSAPQRQHMLYDPKTRNFVPDTHQHQAGRTAPNRRSEESTEPPQKMKIALKEKEKKSQSNPPVLSAEEVHQRR